MQVSDNGGYCGVIEDCRIVRMPDGKSVFKVYYVSIVGRDNPTRYEWAHNPLSKDDYEAALKAAGHEGIGFVTAFPHISKVFRYMPKAEIILTLKAFETQTGKPINLDRGEGFMEFACLAEAVIANDEFRAWAEASTVEEYLKTRCDCFDKELPIRVKNKMKTYWEA